MYSHIKIHQCICLNVLQIYKKAKCLETLADLSYPTLNITINININIYLSIYLSIYIIS